MHTFQEKERDLEEGEHHSSALKCFRLEGTCATSVHSPLVRANHAAHTYAEDRDMNFNGQ